MNERTLAIKCMEEVSNKLASMGLSYRESDDAVIDLHDELDVDGF